MGEIFYGKGVVPGIGIAKAKVLSDDLSRHLASYKGGSPEEEAARLTTAIQDVAAEILRLKEAALAAGEQTQADIMDAHYAMVNDSGLSAAMFGKVEQAVSAPQAALAAAEEYAAMFDSMPDAYLRERAADIRDIGRRLARQLLGTGAADYGSEPVIVCAEEIEPSVAASMPAKQVRGILLGQGSTTSHTVIIAKARGIPAVTGLGDALGRIASGMLVVVDGSTGRVLIDPEPALLKEYQDKADAEEEQKRQDSAMAKLAAVTVDGYKLQLAANIGSPADMPAALAQGAQGVGLFRSEFLFMGRDVPPTEEEQFAAYKEVAEQCNGQLCIIRTMDIGGDKPLRYLNIGKEENPFLGWRAIRISLERPDLFMPQLKAILRAGAYGKVAIMLPMIISAAEIKAARQWVEKAVAELSQEGKTFADKVPLGIMVETPAAAVNASELAAECDFFSIGTNDLVQYTLAVDRGNQAVSALYSHFHPAVLRLIAGVVKAGHDQGIWVGMCGEMAGDVLAAPLLAAMGFDELSMSAPAIPRVKEVIRKIKLAQCQELLGKALALDDAVDIRALLQEFHNRV